MADALLKIENLSHSFKLNKKLWLKAVNNVNLNIFEGEIFGLVGESGSGKSTLARCVMNIYKAQSGKIIYKGVDCTDKAEFKANRKMLQKDRQLIFQDNASSLNQKMKVCGIISEPMRIHHIKPIRGSYREEAAFQLKYVGMDETYLDKYPSELSGGQRQRVAIARAVSMEPGLLVADEPIASLDVSIQAQIINLFKHLREEHGFSILFIAHDLSMVEYLCDRVGVMYRGTLVELAPTAELYSNPLHPYTKALMSAIPIPDPVLERQRRRIDFEAEAFSSSGDFVQVLPEHFVLKEQ